MEVHYKYNYKGPDLCRQGMPTGVQQELGQGNHWWHIGTGAMVLGGLRVEVNSVPGGNMTQR